jgi:cation transport regulator ChaB
MPTGNLPKAAKDMFSAAEASALKGTCKGDKGCAARVGWGAVKRKYKKSGDKWVAKSAGEMDLEKNLEQELTTPVPQDLAGFVVGGGQAGMQCGDCQHWMNQDACEIVAGAIVAEDLCNFYEQSTVIGDQSAATAHMASQFDMVITKASFDPKTGQRRWAAVASDTDLDTFHDRMSISLFKNFIDRIEEGEEAPAIFQSDAWKGGLPYLGISHFLDYDDGYGIAGDTAVVYVDGNRLKAKGLFRDSEVGKAAYEAIKADIVGQVPFEGRTRISIAFVDWQHLHGELPFTRRSLSDVCGMCAAGVDDKIYTKGQLIHLALTRVPVNKRTPIWVEEKSMTTMREDALSVVKDEKIVNELEKRAKLRAAQMLKMKAEGEEIAPDAVVVRQDIPVMAGMDQPYGGATSFKDAEAYAVAQDKMWKAMDSFSMLSLLLNNILDSGTITDKPAAISQVVSEFKDRVDEAVKRSLAVRAAEQILKSSEGNMAGETTPVEEPKVEDPTKVETPAPVPAPTPLDAAVENLKSVVANARADPTKPLADRLKAVQPSLNSLAETIKAEMGYQPSQVPEDIDQRIQRSVATAMQPVLEQLALIAAKSGAVATSTIPPTIPIPRGLQPGQVTPEIKSEVEPQSNIRKLVRKTVAGPYGLQ